MRKLRLAFEVILLVTLLVAPAAAQNNIGNLFVRNTYKGDEMFLNLYYDQAITYYKLALRKDENNTNLQLKIAESYRLKGEYPEALNWYDKVLVDHPEEGKPLEHLNYADALLSAGRYEEARSWYNIYNVEVPEDSRSVRKKKGIANMPFLIRDSLAMHIENLPVNSAFDELASTFYNHGILFLSSRETQSFVDQDYLRNENLLDFYYSAYDSTAGWSTAKLVNNGLNTPYHEGPLALFHGKDKLILTRSNLDHKKPLRNTGGLTQVQLFLFEKQDDHWKSLGPLAFENKEYSFAHPSLSDSNDTLYFSSDVEGGLGGNDLYYSVRLEDHWSDPENLGPHINTEGDEMYPFVIGDRLFFASNGHSGLGGLDIYKAKLINGKATGVVNLGVPVNSPYDDFAYSINLSTLTGTFTSNRPGGQGEDDIYQFTYRNQALNGFVAEAPDGTPINGALIELLHGANVIATTTSDSLGRFHFLLPLHDRFSIQISKEDYESPAPVSVSSALPRIDLDTLKIALTKFKLFAQGRILNNETQQVMPDVRVIIRNATDNEFDTLITDHSGLYRFILKPQKEYNIWAGKRGYLVRGVDINTMKISEGVILNDIVLELEYSKKNVVHFAFDKYDLSKESKIILDRVVRAMLNTPNRLIISAYADARGTKEYNQTLSDRRAETVLNYFISKGFNKSRITARGFGETLMLNRCIDGVNCQEIEHSQNRRAEIKIKGSTVK